MRDEARRVKEVDRLMSAFWQQAVGRGAKMAGYEDEGRQWNALAPEVHLRIEEV